MGPPPTGYQTSVNLGSSASCSAVRRRGQLGAVFVSGKQGVGRFGQAAGVGGHAGLPSGLVSVGGWGPVYPRPGFLSPVSRRPRPCGSRFPEASRVSRVVGVPRAGAAGGFTAGRPGAALLPGAAHSRKSNWVPSVFLVIYNGY